MVKAKIDDFSAAQLAVVDEERLEDRPKVSAALKP